MDDYILAFDIGGTKTYAALVERGGGLVAETQATTVRWSGQTDYRFACAMTC
jgi:sugar (pentulose or hexulose) kinase